MPHARAWRWLAQGVRRVGVRQQRRRPPNRRGQLPACRLGRACGRGNPLRCDGCAVHRCYRTPPRLLPARLGLRDRVGVFVGRLFFLAGGRQSQRPAPRNAWRQGQQQPRHGARNRWQPGLKPGAAAARKRAVGGENPGNHFAPVRPAGEGKGPRKVQTSTALRSALQVTGAKVAMNGRDRADRRCYSQPQRLALDGRANWPIHGGLRPRRRTDLLVILQFRDNWMVATQRAVWIAAGAKFAKVALQGVDHQ